MPWYDKYKQVSDNTARSIPLPTGKNITTDTSPYTQNQFLSLMETTGAIGTQKRNEEEARIKSRNSAASVVDSGKGSFTFPNGTTKEYSEMNPREAAYIKGQALQTRGRFFPNEESYIDDLNPLSWIGNMASNIAQAPYEAQQSNSNLPYATALAEPLLMGRMTGSGTINPFSKKMWTNEISDKAFVNNLGMGVPGLAEKGVNKIVQSTESGLLSNAYKYNPYAFKPNPEAYYRGIGRSGLDDALESKVLRTANKTGNYGEDLYMTKDFIVAKGTYSRDAPTLTGDSWDFNTWKMSPPKDPKSYIAEIPKNAVLNIENPGSNIYINKGPLPLKDIKLYKENWLQGYKQVEVPKINFDNYLTQKQAVQARAERMLSQENKWVGQNNDELITNFNNASKNHYDDLTSFEWNSKFNDAKSLESLGVNKFGKTVVYKDAPLSEANKARTAAHETGHYYKNTFEEGKDWNSFFDFSLQKQKTRDYLGGKGMRGRGHIKGDEIRERAAQLKDYIAHKNKIPLNQDFTVTKSQLDDALKNYTKDTKLDNTMTPFISSLKDKNGFLKAMNKYALTTIPAAVATGAATQEYQNGGQIPLHNKSKWMKDEISKNALYGNPAAYRMFSESPKTGMTPEGAGTHYMTTYDNYAVPLLQDKGGKYLEYNKTPNPSREDFKFNNSEDANFFAEHYKEVAPMMNNWTDKYKN